MRHAATYWKPAPKNPTNFYRLDATTGLTYAGQTFDKSADGNPVGVLQQETIALKNGSLRFRKQRLDRSRLFRLSR